MTVTLQKSFCLFVLYDAVEVFIDEVNYMPIVKDRFYNLLFNATLNLHS